MPQIDLHVCRGDYRPTPGAPQVVRVANPDGDETWWTFEGSGDGDDFPARLIIRWCPYCGVRLTVPADIASRYRVVHVAREQAARNR